MIRTVAVALLTFGCSPSPVAPCATHIECRDAFGFGQTCNDEGYCEAAELPARCASTWPPDLLDSPEQSLILGSLYDGGYDVAEMQSVRLAVMQANESGGLGGQPIGLLECTYEPDFSGDGLDYSDAVGAIASRLVDEFGIEAFVGPYTSSETESAWLAIESVGEAFVISPSATSPALTWLDGLTKTDEQPGLLWRTAPPDSLQGQVAAADMLDRASYVATAENVRFAAVIFEADAYGRGLAEIFQERFAEGGGTAYAYEFSTDTVLSEAVADVKTRADVQEIFFISSDTSTIATFLKQLASVGGFENKGIFLSDAAADTDMLAEAASASGLFDQIRGTRPAVPSGTLYDAFAASYQAAYDEDPYATVYMPYAYDAAWLALYGTAWSHHQEGAVSPVGIARGLRRVSSGSELQLKASSWTTLQSYFDEGQAVDVRGTTGSLDYDPETEETTAPIEVWLVDASGTSFVVQYTIEP